MQKWLFISGLIVPLAACDLVNQPQQAGAVGGKSFGELRLEHSEMSALDFTEIDTNRDGIVDAEEEAAGDFDF